VPKQKKTINLGINRSKDHDRLYRHIEEKLGIKEKKCSRGQSGRRGKFGLKHQGKNPVPIRQFYLLDIYIDPKTDKVVLNKGDGLQGACIACDKAYRAARSKKNNRRFKDFSADQIRKNYIREYGKFKGCSMCDPGKKRITPYEVGISKGMETGLHNTCKKCAKAYSESVSSRWEIVSPDGHHPVKIQSLDRCRVCNSRTKLHKDHIWPLSKGGTDRKDNIQILCQDCNLKKSDQISSFYLGFSKIENLKFSMVCERYHALLEDSKAKDLSLRLFELEITKAVRGFIGWKKKLSNQELLDFFRKEKKRNNRKHSPEHAVKSFRRYCDKAILDFNEHIKRNQNK